MAIFSGNGKKIFSIDFASPQENHRIVTLPELSSGINIIRITMGNTTLTRTLVRVGNELFM